MNGIGTLSWANIKSAVVYGVLMAVVTFLLVVGNSIITHGSIYGLDWPNIIDEGVLAVLAVLVAGVSLLKNLLTDNQGNFLGVTKVVDTVPGAVSTSVSSTAPGAVATATSTAVSTVNPSIK